MLGFPRTGYLRCFFYRCPPLVVASLASSAPSLSPPYLLPSHTCRVFALVQCVLVFCRWILPFERKADKETSMHTVDVASAAWVWTSGRLGPTRPMVIFLLRWFRNITKHVFMSCLVVAHRIRRERRESQHSIPAGRGTEFRLRGGELQYFVHWQALSRRVSDRVYWRRIVPTSETDSVDWFRVIPAGGVGSVHWHSVISAGEIGGVHWLSIIAMAEMDRVDWLSTMPAGERRR